MSGKKQRKRGQKKTRTIVLVLLLFFFSILALSAEEEVFRFQYRSGQQYKILTNIEEQVYINGAFNHSADLLYKIAVEIVDTKEDAGKIKANFLISQRATGSGGTYRWEEAYPSVSWRTDRGLYTIDSSYFMPVVRNVPTFPEGPVEPGDTWTAQGEEVQDFREFGIGEPFRIPIEVEYRYVGKVEKEGKELDLFTMRYSASYTPPSMDRTAMMYPVKVRGSSYQVLYFDNEKGLYHSFEEDFHFIYVFNNGYLIEYRGSGEARVVETEEMDKDKVAEDIKKELEKENVPDTDVKADERGVTISLEDIRFKPDSYDLQDSEKKKMETLGKILKKYPDRDILITGHTALAGTPEGRQTLSEERAKAVGNYLLSLGVIREDQMIFKGMGAREPVASNATVEGMKKNRRVEITILDN